MLVRVNDYTRVRVNDYSRVRVNNSSSVRVPDSSRVRVNDNSKGFPRLESSRAQPYCSRRLLLVRPRQA